jgi:hypothetical protein
MFHMFKDIKIYFASYILNILNNTFFFTMARAPADRKKTATIYKSEKRKEMEEEGYRILGNSGDQWSDLLGFSTSARSFKLPNPMYYIP